MKYFTGDIKRMYVKNVTVDGNISNIETESVVLIKDSPFYCNIVGRLISMKYNTFLPTYSEADYVVERLARLNPDNLEAATCIYADYDNMKAHNTSKQDFKVMKKNFKIGK